MSSRVLVVGGSGLLGEPIVRRLVESGSDVTVATRGNLPLPESLRRAVRFEKLDREAAGAIEATARDGFDGVVDVIPYRVEHAEQLLRLEGKAGSIVAISSASVYADADGRPLLRGIDTWPERPLPIPESQPAVRPEARSYAGGKAAVEATLSGAGSASGDRRTAWSDLRGAGPSLA